ncbi:hypothetical protein BU14_0256s0043 [Porphyra umbilicalis]|uniref:Uncharacterized protein n=1 Tax=Porphyra umbilicalis TaxID=2786 RepID=A0A1X6P2X2_PORUM|nr:hypothetical protein BU14_0256s0043 [Porphyra umbilicalis]|eukprot:OSX75090.1 hypothetical protein BU14_0256s0043 [Porphyra umbilicalis]
MRGCGPSADGHGGAGVVPPPAAAAVGASPATLPPPRHWRRMPPPPPPPRPSAAPATRRRRHTGGRVRRRRASGGTPRWGVAAATTILVAVAVAVAAGATPAAGCEFAYDPIRCLNALNSGVFPCLCPTSNWFYTWTCCLPGPDGIDDPAAPLANSCWCESKPTGGAYGAVGGLVVTTLACLAVAGVNAWRGVGFQVVDEAEDD